MLLICIVAAFLALFLLYLRKYSGDKVDKIMSCAINILKTLASYYLALGDINATELLFFLIQIKNYPLSCQSPHSVSVSLFLLSLWTFLH